MALIDAPQPAAVPQPSAEPGTPDPEAVHAPEPAAPPSPVPGTSGLLDLEPLLVRSLGTGILGGVVVALVLIAVPLTITRGFAYGLGVGGMVAFWCGIGFGMIAGSAAYVARSGH